MQGLFAFFFLLFTLICKDLQLSWNHLPLKAKEILNGAGETVPSTGIIVMESTHEGAKSGLNYDILKGAMEN